jgi:hypothetical protein
MLVKPTESKRPFLELSTYNPSFSQRSKRRALIFLEPWQV